LDQIHFPAAGLLLDPFTELLHQWPVIRANRGSEEFKTNDIWLEKGLNFGISEVASPLGWRAESLFWETMNP
jgi:hypothetical protein